MNHHTASDYDKLGQSKNECHSNSKNWCSGQDTIFSFSQRGNIVKADYSGGKIENGFLVGVVKNDTLEFSYCQLDTDQVLDNGSSVCQIESQNGKIRLTEHFEWGSRPGEMGTNVFEEI